MAARIADPLRLAALERSGLLRHGLHERLVHLCYTATELLNVDASQINAVTDSEQIFVAEWPRVRRENVPLSNSGCKEVVESEQTLIIPNTVQHPVMCLMPWSAHWGGYLGCPVTYQGQVLGSICALTVDPRGWTTRDVLTLEGLAELVSASLCD